MLRCSGGGGDRLRLEPGPRAAVRGYSVTSRGAGIKSYRSIWISDLHFGAHRSRALALHDFLRCHEAAKLFLVGDILEGWNAGAGRFWNLAQRAVVNELRTWSRLTGVRVENFSNGLLKVNLTMLDFEQMACYRRKIAALENRAVFEIPWMLEQFMEPRAAALASAIRFGA